MRKHAPLLLVLLFLVIAPAGCKTATSAVPRRLALMGNRDSAPDPRIRVLYVESSPRYEYRSLVRVLTSRNKDLVVWCLLLSATEDFAQEHTQGTYLADDGKEEKIQSLSAFPTPEELSKFDVIIWGDVDPAAAEFGMGPGALESVRQFVLDGGALICILGENYLPGLYAKGEAGEALGGILPFKIAKPENPADSEGRLMTDVAPSDTAFKFLLTGAGKKCDIFKLADKDSEELWSADSKDSLPGMYWFWRIEQDPAETDKALVYLRHAGDKPEGLDANYALIFEKNVGKGIVFVSAIDETWRWRYRYGDEPYFAGFWLKVIKRVAER
jgi:hypothetical protein